MATTRYDESGGPGPGGPGAGPQGWQGPPGPGYGGWGGGYGHGGPWGAGRRRSYPIETKPFFLTSEFAVFLIAEIALVITAVSSDSIDAWRFWILSTVLVSLYMLSRGVAKSGTKSRAFDPREELDIGRRESGGATAER